MVKNPLPLYDICIKAAVEDTLTKCGYCKKDYRLLPNTVLFDFYYALIANKRLCLLSVEFSQPEVFSRMLSVKHKRPRLLRSFQAFTDHGSSASDQLVQEFGKMLESNDDKLSSSLANKNNSNDDATSGSSIKESEDYDLIDLGLRMGGFFNEGGWYQNTIEVLKFVETSCQRRLKMMEKGEEQEDGSSNSSHLLKKLLECYKKRIIAETVYCEFDAAKTTFSSAMEIIEQLKQLNELPNLAGLYASFSTMFFHRSEYDEAFSWAQKALMLLDDRLPKLIIVDVLRQASRACVIKRRFDQAGLLVRQAVNLATELYEADKHPRLSDTLLDYGFYLLNYDSIKESVKVYNRALHIRKQVFERHNILLALAHEDIAYALYVNEYSSGRFYTAREHAERSIFIMEHCLPKNHLMLSSAKRVKALILEEIALDLREGANTALQDQYLIEAESLHKTALDLSFKAFGEKNVQTAKHYGNLGRLYQSMKRYEEAETMHLKAIAIKEELLGKNDYEVGLSVGHLASLYNYHMDRPQDAERLYVRSMDINMHLFGDTYSGFEYDYRGLINVYSKLGDVDRVAKYTCKMRDWQVRRELQPPTQSDAEILTVDEILKKFKSLSCG